MFPAFREASKRILRKNNSIVIGYCNKPITKAEFNGVTEGNASTALSPMYKFTFE